MARPTFRLKDQAYIPSTEYGWKQFYTERRARAEYARLRDIAQKRLKRLRTAGYSAPADFIKTGDLNEKTLAGALARVHSFLSSPASTVKGRKSKAGRIAQTLMEHGYKIDNVDRFGEFMEEWRAQYGQHARGSEQAAELYQAAELAQIPLDEIYTDFEKYIDSVAELDDLLEQGDFANIDELREWFGFDLLI